MQHSQDFTTIAAEPLRSSGDPSLDTIETTVQKPWESAYRQFLTSGMRSKCDRIEFIHQQWDQKTGKQRYKSLMLCRSSAFFEVERQTREVRVSASTCGLRWCPLCSRVKVLRTVGNVLKWLQPKPAARFITLTLKHNDQSLAEQIDRLYRHFKNLRRNPNFKRRINGGIWFFQIKRGRTDGCWHPHLHILADGKYISQKQLSDLWLLITHDSPIVDIRIVKDKRKAAEYVARYAANPCDISEFEPEDGLEVVQALHGRRIAGTWGTGKSCKLCDKLEPDDGVWDIVASFREVIDNKEFDPELAYLFECWQERRRYDGSLGNPPPEPQEFPPPTELCYETYEQATFYANWDNWKAIDIVSIDE